MNRGAEVARGEHATLVRYFHSNLGGEITIDVLVPLNLDPTLETLALIGRDGVDLQLALFDGLLRIDQLADRLLNRIVVRRICQHAKTLPVGQQP